MKRYHKLLRCKYNFSLRYISLHISVNLFNFTSSFFKFGLKCFFQTIICLYRVLNEKSSKSRRNDCLLQVPWRWVSAQRFFQFGNAHETISIRKLFWTRNQLRVFKKLQFFQNAMNDLDWNSNSEMVTKLKNVAKWSNINFCKNIQNYSIVAHKFVSKMSSWKNSMKPAPKCCDWTFCNPLRKPTHIFVIPKSHDSEWFRKKILSLHFSCCSDRYLGE
jgi:hypothetical protein